jgi:hypothetical protein
MTLVLATIMKDGAVLTADRRAMIYSHSTGEEKIWTDNAEKVFTARNLAIAIIGDSKNISQLASQLISEWVKITYDPDADFVEQVEQLYDNSFKSGDYGFFVAVQTDSDGTTVANTRDGFEVERLCEIGKTKIKFFGSGNAVASKLVDNKKPKFKTFDSKAILDFSAEIILKTHTELEKNKAELNSVGNKIMAAAITNEKTELLYRVDDDVYTDNYQFPTSKLLEDDLLKIKNAVPDKKPKLFADYCQKAINAKISGSMPLRDAAYSIAQTMFLDELNGAIFEKITSLAGELELPPKFFTGNPEDKWLELIALVEEYKIAIRNDKNYL